jgi:hypothetical protein
MTYYNIAVYLHDGNFYHHPPGMKVFCYMDENHKCYYGGKEIKVSYNNPKWDGTVLYRTHSVRPLPGSIPKDNRNLFNDVHGLIRERL